MAHHAVARPKTLHQLDQKISLTDHDDHHALSGLIVSVFYVKQASLDRSFHNPFIAIKLIRSSINSGTSTED